MVRWNAAEDAPAGRMRRQGMRRSGSVGSGQQAVGSDEEVVKSSTSKENVPHDGCGGKTVELVSTLADYVVLA